MDNPIPNPNLVGGLFWSIFKPQWIRLALTLGIFTPFVASPSDALDFGTQGISFRARKPL